MSHTKPPTLTIESVGYNTYVLHSSRPGEAAMTRIEHVLGMIGALSVERVAGQPGAIQFSMIDAAGGDEIIAEIGALL